MLMIKGVERKSIFLASGIEDGQLRMELFLRWRGIFDGNSRGW